MFALAVTLGSFNPVVSGTVASIVMNSSVAADDAFAMAIIGLTTLLMFVIAIMTENRTTTMVPTSPLPSEYCLIPNQNAIANVPYIPIIMGDMTRPIRGAALRSFVAALSSKASCNLANFASAPNAVRMRTDENISKAMAEASS